jgi:CubicO group peptidase (beta-lactamase class C family)
VDRWRKVSHDPRPAGGRKGDARPLQAPGTYWEYNDVRINQLSLALLHLFGRPLPEVFRDEVLPAWAPRTRSAGKPTTSAWVTIDGQRLPSVPGGTHWGGGVSISARDQARIGQLLLDGGRDVLPPGWTKLMRTPCGIAPFYGLLVWLNADGRGFPGASTDAVFMQGAGGHMVWVDPGLDAVIVTRWLDPAHTGDFVTQLASALRAG